MTDLDDDRGLAEQRARVLDALSRHPDPVMREIGTQLASGVLAPHQLLQDSHYLEALRRRLEQLNQSDGGELRAKLFAQSGPVDPDNGQISIPVGRR